MSEVEQVQTEVVVTEPTPIETEARSQGWVPKTEFRGNEAEWIEAEVFVQRGKEINPILRKNNERIQKELDATKRQMEDLKKTTEEFKKFQKEAYEHKIETYTLEIQDLKELKKKAVSEGDGELVVNIDDKIDEVKAKQASAKLQETDEKTTPPVDPVVQKAIESWVEDNSWYKTDKKMAAATDAVAAQVRQANPFLIGKEFFDEVDKELQDLFPAERLGKKVRPRSPVEAGKSVGESKGGKKSYDNLPPEAKAACDKFVRQKLMSKEEYVTMFQWD